LQFVILYSFLIIPSIEPHVQWKWNFTLFRPQQKLIFNPGNRGDGGFVVPFLSRGYVRSSLTPGIIIKSLQDFQPSIFVIPYSTFLILSSNPSPFGGIRRGLFLFL
jgi:hypothetical protein